eukprot:TRINITY_DN19628_c1_g1_i1.p1 TRINITY_DN19628_c1_g1~~TRINITY_DN19628_c1_g1_i1.p1  ORF type:complete len:744 (+),score=128.06 TRINITY_DN19628_c1_g1_i1:626-2857(+)
MTDCLICCEENVKEWGEWECGHKACYLCVLRLRLSSSECVMCKRSSETVRLYTGTASGGGEKHPAQGWNGVLCEGKGLAEKVAKLKIAKCTMCNWKPTGGLKGMLRHCKEEHDKAPCRVCITGRKQMFIHEHPLYTSSELKLHESVEEDCHIDPSNFLGHPLCRFCSTPCYDNGALYEHVTLNHYNCLLCDSAGSSTVTSITVYKDIQKIAEHYRKHHHYCDDCHAEGASKPGYDPAKAVFSSEERLKLHRAKVHKRKLALGDFGVSSNTATQPEEQPAFEPSAQPTAFSIIFVHGSKNQEKILLLENKSARQSQQEPQGTALDRDVSETPGRGRGRGRGRGGRGGTIEPSVAIKQKFAVEFSDKSGMSLKFNPHTRGGLMCHYGDNEAGVVTTIEYNEGDEKLSFAELKKRVKIPKDVHAKGLANLERVCKENNVDYKVIEKIPVVIESKTPTMREASPITEEIQEEVDTLLAVYGDELTPHPTQPTTWTIRIKTTYGENDKEASILMSFSYPKAYPDVPPLIEFNTDSSCGVASSFAVLGYHIKNGLEQAVLADYCPGEPIVYSCIDWVNECFEEQLTVQLASLNLQSEGSSSVEYSNNLLPVDEEVLPPGLNLIEGPPLVDRKSKFVAHCAAVKSAEEAMMVVRSLQSIKRIAVAAHPTIYAYRVVDEKGKVREERDDDGESGAADKLLFFLQRANVQNYIVVVTRWYGGIHLGPDRFKHILTVAKELLQQQNVIPEPKK